MDLHSGHPLWPLRHGLLTVVPPLSGDLSCEVLVVGAGITGALVAHRLVEAGIECAVIDRRDLGQGSTSASTALLQYDIDVPLVELIEQIGRPRAERAYRAGVEAIDELGGVAGGLGCAFERRPSLYFTRDTGDVAFMQRELAAREAAGLEVRWVDAAGLDGGWGVRAAGAILSGRAAQVDPYLLTHRLMQGCIDRGVPVHDRTAVQDIDEGSAGVTVTTDRGTVRASWVVMATGYESVAWLPRKVVSLHSTFAVASEPVAPEHRWADGALVWEHAEAYLYARWTDDGRLLFGGGDVGFKHVAARDRLLGAKAAALVEDLQALCPGVPIEPAFCWAGTFGSTKDGLGYIGAPEGRERVLFALGFGGNGITYSEIASRILVDRVRGREHPDAGLFAFGRG